MTINSISSTDVAPTPTPYPLLKESRQDFTDLLKAMKSGDTEAAQAAFGALKEDVQAIQQKVTDAGLTPFFGTRPVEDLEALHTAIQAGDVSEAKKALHTLAQDLRQIRRHHVMREHRRDDNDGGLEAVETGSEETTSVGGSINVTA